MATNSLQAESVSANPAELIYGRATKLQGLCSQIRSLADAVSDEAFNRTDDANTFNFAQLIMKIVDEVADDGEAIEKLSVGLKKRLV